MPSATAVMLMIILALRHGVEHLLLGSAPGGRASGRAATVLLFLGSCGCAGGALWTVWARDPGRMGPAAAGWALLAAGVALRFWSRRVLGRFFSYDTVIRDNHCLVDTGPYALCRHPLSVGMLAETVGCALVGGVWPLGVPCALVGAALVLRNPHEERRLAEELGESYRRYSEAVPGMNLPWGLVRFLLRSGRPVWR